ncbi:MAG: thiamine pyrophosphate-dependent enzyme [Candidatus Bipolaricaulaceae bacterium]
MSAHPLHAFLRPEALPTVFCPGCGNGLVAGAILRALVRAQVELRKTVFVAGIGCAAWIPSPHFWADSLHVAHGRAIPTALGIKLRRPELNVIVVGGDGDIAGIGGNHLLHAARRNADLLVVMVNNLVYAMTGGQVGPTTPHGLPTSTTPYGNPEYPMDVAGVVAAAGANYVARWTTAHLGQLEQALVKALGKEGFRFVEVVSQCPARVGGRLAMAPVEAMKWLRAQSRPVGQAGPEEIAVGEHVERDRPGFLRTLKEDNRG